MKQYILSFGIHFSVQELRTPQFSSLNIWFSKNTLYHSIKINSIKDFINASEFSWPRGNTPILESNDPGYSVSTKLTQSVSKLQK